MLIKQGYQLNFSIVSFSFLQALVETLEWSDEMTKDQFKEFQNGIHIGEEYNFHYGNNEYWISQDEERFYLTKVKGSVTQEFSTAKQLFEEGKVDGRFISDIYEDIEW